MFLIAGIVLVIVGFGAAAVMNLMATPPEFLFQMPGGMLGWVGLGFLGVIFLVLGRRPSD
ncbi:MAG TPA: hypothetical protein PKI11_10435 [Candidatus Hydrogenedentes bacterium]|nr:hypothetical protein [Candidatus Hydrogenedentota bacterium]